MEAAPPFQPTDDLVRAVAAMQGTPAYVYDEVALRERARRVASFGGPFGFTPRYAMKANPNAAILRLFSECGLHFDASSTFEARRAVQAGIPASHIQLTAQMHGTDLDDLMREGVLVTACSVAQIERVGRSALATDIGLRINPGRGSGHNNRTNVAGPNASFGIWHDQVDAAHEVARSHGLRVTHAHHHVGSGGDPNAWGDIAAETLSIVERLPDVHTVNLGGGFKVARVAGETESDLDAAAAAAHALIESFAERTGRKLHVEIEPGTYLIATAGALIARVVDLASTGADGHEFVKLDAGMAEILRPSMYGAQHPIRIVSADGSRGLGETEAFQVVGPCCESGDILTPSVGDAEGLAARELPRPHLGDLAVIGATGAYCASMAARNYNSIPAAPELLVRTDGSIDVIRRRQTLEDVLREEP